MTFRGWPKEALDFYVGLEADNSRQYWLAHKAVYDESVKAPFLELSDAVESEFGPLRMFRPNRDIRFSKDKSPYKIAAAAATEGEGGAAYYVQISSGGLYVGSGYYHLIPDQLERYRVAVADARRPEAATAVAAVRKQRYNVDSRDSLKPGAARLPEDHPRIELLRKKGMHAGKEFGAPGWLRTKARSTASSRRGAMRGR